MAALRRGIARYADGTPDVRYPAAPAAPAAPIATPVSPKQIAQSLSMLQQPPAQAGIPAAPQVSLVSKIATLNTPEGERARRQIVDAIADREPGRYNKQDRALMYSNAFAQREQFAYPFVDNNDRWADPLMPNYGRDSPSERQAWEETYGTIGVPWNFGGVARTTPDYLIRSGRVGSGGEILPAPVPRGAPIVPTMPAGAPTEPNTADWAALSARINQLPARAPVTPPAEPNTADWAALSVRINQLPARAPIIPPTGPNGQQGNTNMAPLRRGIARYANGTPDVEQMQPPQQALATVPATPVAPDQIAQSLAMVQQPPTPTPAPASAPQKSFRELLGDAIGMRGPAAREAAFSGGQLPVPAVPAERSPLSTVGSMLTGGFGDVLSDPRSSALSHLIAGINQDAQTQQRVRNLTTGPSVLEKVVKGIFGTQDDWHDIQSRDTTANAMANALKNPLVNSHLMTHDDALREAESNPAAFAAKAQTSEFLKFLQDAKDHHTNLTTNGAVHDDGKGPPIVIPPDQIDDHAAAAKVKATVPGTTDAQAVGAIQPHKLTADEFARVFDGMSVRAFSTLFGARLAHIQSPQEAIQRKYFADQYADYENINQRQAALKAADPTKNKAEIDKLEAEKVKRWAQITSDMKSFGGVTQKQYPMMPEIAD